MPRIVDKEAKRRALALAALQVFVDEGFERASVARVAAVAGVGKGTLYEYFRSKETMAVAAFEVVLSDMIEGIDAHIAEVDGALAKIEAYARAGVAAFEADPGLAASTLTLFQILVRAPLPPDDRRALLDLHRKAHRHLGQLLLDAVASGDLPPRIAAEADSHALHLLAFLDGLALHTLVAGDAFDAAAETDRFVDGWLDTLRR